MVSSHPLVQGLSLRCRYRALNLTQQILSKDDILQLLLLLVAYNTLGQLIVYYILSQIYTCICMSLPLLKVEPC